MNEFKKIFNYFLIGILAITPIVVVLQIMLFVKLMVSGLFQSVYAFADSYIYTLIVLTISFVILVSIGHTIVQKGGSWIINTIDLVISKVPLLNTVYRVLKKIVNMVGSHDQEFAKEVVYVEYPKEGIWVPAYITNRFENKYVLFIPTSPNPTSGFTVIVDKSKVIKSAMNIEQATSFIVSVGVDFDSMSELNKLN